MKRFKKIYILLGVLIVVCVATVAVTRLEERKEQIKNSDAVILELPGDSVQALSWEYENTTLAFHRDETWLYDEDEAFPVDAEKIDALLERFQAFGVSFIIEDVEDYGQYGLDDPICTIHLTAGDQSYEILLGDYSILDSQRYVSIGDGNVYLVSSDPLDSFNATLSDLIDHDEVPAFDQAAQIRFAGAEEYTITYEEDSRNTYCADDVYFTQQSGTTLPLDTSRVERYLNTIRSLGLTDYVTYNVSDAQLQTYGLDEPELTVTVEYASENEEGEEVPDSFTLSVSRDPAEREAAEDAEEEAVTAYARVGDSPIVYQISSSSYTALMAAAYDDLRHPEVLSADFSEITRIDVTLEGVEYRLVTEGGDGDRTWLYQDEELEIDPIRNALESLTADSFTTERPTEQEEIRLTVSLDNEDFPQVRIELYRYDGTHCLAVVDGEPVSLVARSSVVDLIEAVHAIVLN